MSPKKIKITLYTTIAVLTAITAGVAVARTPVTHHTTMDFRSLIVQGERPEIAACIVAALNLVRTDAKFDSVRWTEEDSERAIMRESESGDHFLRSVRFKARVREREHPLLTENWRPAEIVCEQRDEQSPEVRITTLNR